MFDKAIERIRDQLGIFEVAGWSDVTPAMVTRIEGIGQVTLDQRGPYQSLLTRLECHQLLLLFDHHQIQYAPERPLLQQLVTL